MYDISPFDGGGGAGEISHDDLDKVRLSIKRSICGCFNSEIDYQMGREGGRAPAGENGLPARPTQRGDGSTEWKSIRKGEREQRERERTVFYSFFFPQYPVREKSGTALKFPFPYYYHRAPRCSRRRRRDAGAAMVVVVSRKRRRGETFLTAIALT